MMAAARAKYAANPALLATIRADAVVKLAKALPPAPETLEFNERVDRGIALSSDLVAEAQAQLAAPVSAFLPAELTPSELAELPDAENWMHEHWPAEATVDRMMANSQALYEQLMGQIDAAAHDPLTPPPSPSQHGDVKVNELISHYDALATKGCTCHTGLNADSNRPQPLSFVTTTAQQGTLCAFCLGFDS